MNPNVAIASKNGSRTSIDAMGMGSCLHCGRSASYRTKVGTDSISFCCSGCEGVYRFLKSQGLDRYYQILTGLKHQAPTQNTDDESNLLDHSSYQKIDPFQFKYDLSSGSYAIYVPAFNCAACLWIVEKILAEVAGLDQFRINLEQRLLILTLDGDHAESILSNILQKLSAIGYNGFIPPTNSGNDPSSNRISQDLIHLGIAGAIFANVMLFSSSVYFIDFFGHGQDFSRYFNIISLVLATIAIFVAGKSFFQNSLRSLKTRTIHIDLPIAFALTVAFCTSAYHMYAGIKGVYFDSITGLIFFLRLGRYMSDSLIARARYLFGSSKDTFIPQRTDLQIGSEIGVDQGTVIPADGTIVSGIAEVSEAFLNGESLPRVKAVGDTVYGGTLNLGAPFRITVSATGNETRLARISRLISEVSLQRANSETRTAFIAKWFIIGTIALSLLAIAIWSGNGFSTVFNVVCSLLIVSCPCALAMAIPLTNALAIKRCWKSGIVVRDINAFEQSREIDTIVFDKTGTLTTGKMEVMETYQFSANDEFPTGILERITRDCIHPVPRAIHKWSQRFISDETFVTSSTVNHPGQGMALNGVFTGETIAKPACVFIGSLTWLTGLSQSAQIRSFLIQDRNIPKEYSVCGILIQYKEMPASEERALVLSLKDQHRADAGSVVSTARAFGFKIRLLSGDRYESAIGLGKTLGFTSEEIFAEQLPDQKVAFVEALKKSGRHVMMVGDGFNDAAVMKSSAIGIAVAGGTDLTRETADVFLTKSSLRGVIDIIMYSHYHYRTQQLILGTSLIYNLVAMGLALCNRIHPLTAALIMPLSSLTVLVFAWIRKGGSVWKSCAS